MWRSGRRQPWNGNGTVTDPTGAVVPGATVKIQNPVSQYRAHGDDGRQRDISQFTNVPYNSYHMTAEANGLWDGGPRCRRALEHAGNGAGDPDDGRDRDHGGSDWAKTW